jgi:hypothetical protein
MLASIFKGITRPSRSEQQPLLDSEPSRRPRRGDAKSSDEDDVSANSYASQDDHDRQPLLPLFSAAHLGKMVTPIALNCV